MSDPRLVIVSNRLPVTATTEHGELQLTHAAGGLATGMRPYHEQSNGLWVGWPGDVSKLTADQRTDLDARLRAERIVPVFLSRDHVERYYNGFSNRVLWPLFHYLIDRVPVEATGFDAYRQVNAAFADVVVREYRPGDMVWVHDYQLMLLPQMLRERLPNLRIGFFLHIPFPSSEVFRVLPWRREILRGLLGADLIGVHTFSYMRHFLASLLHVEGVEAEIDRVRVGGRDVQLGVFPMGVDAAGFARLAADPEVITGANAVRRDAGGRRVVLGVDRLDYTKGIPRRLQAVERLFQTHPEWRDGLRYIQVAVPSRGEVDSYQRFRRDVEERVGRINGICGTLASTPVHYVHRSVDTVELTSLYTAADVMLVTPLRDGMNLVAKEFVASRIDDDGVLVLSEFAGASAELDGSVCVNPYDVAASAEAIHRALTMTPGERRARMTLLRRRVIDHDIHAWARSFIDRLSELRPRPTQAVSRPEPSLVTLVTEAQRHRPIRLLLDYDGTLVPLARAPELAAPDEEVLALLHALAVAPNVHVDLVSGRPRENLEEWFAHLPIDIWAEHGFWHRMGLDGPWKAAASVSVDWMARLRPLLDQFTAATPGSQLEIKTASVAWHYRRAQREFGERQAHELRMLLGDTLSNQPLEVLEGSKVIEIRLRGVSKALVALHVADVAEPDALIIAIGDDRTDDDLFRALTPNHVTVAVGHRPTRAAYHVDDYRAVRGLLRLLVDGAAPARGGVPPTAAARPPAAAVKTGARKTGETSAAS